MAMREAWRELMFADPDQDAKKTRDPVAPAKRSEAAEIKATSRQLRDGTPTHSFLHSWMNSVPSCATLAALPMPALMPQHSTSPQSPIQQRAFESIKSIQA